MLHAVNPRRACALAALLLALPLGGCGLVESIVEGFVDDRDVTLEASQARSGTIIRQTDGTDVEAQGGTYIGGDTNANDFCVCAIVFDIDPSQQPDKTEIDRATLRVWVDHDAGNPAPLAPVVLSHLPAHPDQPLGPGVVPHPAGTDIATIDDVSTPGWRQIDVTPWLLQDWNAHRPVSAFALRLGTMTDGDGQGDTVLFENPGGGARAELVLTFSVDL